MPIKPCNRCADNKIKRILNMRMYQLSGITVR